MAEYRLLENVFAAPEMGSLFQGADFHRLHAGEAAAFFEWAHDETVVASIHFTACQDGLCREAELELAPGFISVDQGCTYGSRPDGSCSATSSP